ncbi:MAG: hypothetical protein ACE5HO_02445 [bacterium]
MTKRVSLAFALTLAVFELAFAQVLVQTIDEFGTVDWQRMVVRASGIGVIQSTAPSRVERVESLETAKETAAEHLLRAVESLRFDHSARVKDVVLRNVQARARLKSIVETYTVIDTRSMSDMSLEVEIELPITGDLIDLLLPQNCGKGQLRLSDESLCPTCGQPWPEGKPVPPNVKLINLAEGITSPEGTPYTGLIVDARGLGLKAAIVPKILDEEGHEIYGTDYFARESAIESGAVLYKRHLKSAINDPRTGREPMIVRGRTVAGALKTDVVISNSDAALIHSAAHTDNFLKKCKVIIVIGS